MKLCVQELSADERADLARLLSKAGFTVRPLKLRETEKGPRKAYLEFGNGKELAYDNRI